MPNEDAAKWLIRDVWPMIKREFPRAQLRLVGRGSEGYLRELGPDIIGLVGWRIRETKLLPGLFPSKWVLELA